MAKYIGALDLGTTSNRFIVFDHQGRIIGFDQMEHEQILPRPGWVEHDVEEIWESVGAAVTEAIERVLAAPSELGIVASRPEDGRFFEDFCNWQRIDEIERFVRSSRAAAIAGALTVSYSKKSLRSPKAKTLPSISTIRANLRLGGWSETTRYSLACVS